MNWPTVLLHDICRPKQWPTISAVNLKESGYTVYGANGRIGFYDQFTHKDPTVLITCRGATCGTINICEPFSYVNGNAMALDDLDKKVDLNFLARYLQIRGLRDAISGSAQPQITREGLRGITVPLPSLEEQRQIAAILDKADALCQKRRLALQKLDSLTQSIFHDIFGDPASNPRQWQLAQLGDVIHFATDGPHVSPSYEEVGVPFLSARHIRPGEVSWTDMKYISSKDAEIQWRKCKPAQGDLLYTKGGTTGVAAVVDFETPIAIWVHVAMLKTNHDVVEPLWLESMLNTGYCYQQSQRLTHGIANRDLGLTRMVKIDIYLPPRDLQVEFVRNLYCLRRDKKRQQESLGKLDTLFGSLQRRAFRGEL